MSSYRMRRKEAKATTRLTTRCAALNGQHREQKITSGHSPEYIATVEAVIDDAVVLCQRVAIEEFAMTTPITIRHDWTYRTAQASSPRSFGGNYSPRFRQLDLADDEKQFAVSKGPGISLRLGKYPERALDCSMHWHEYTGINEHPLIGAKNGTFSDYLRLLVCHEAGHAIVFGGRDLPDACALLNQAGADWKAAGIWCRVSRKTDDLHGAHEAIWQAVYYRLRVALGFAPGSSSSLDSATIAETAAKLNEAHRYQSCTVCGESFKVKKATQRVQKFCSTKCRVKAHRAEKNSMAL